MHLEPKRLVLSVILLLGYPGRGMAAGYFSDDFESYVVGTSLASLAQRGWGASSNSVIVTSNAFGNTTKLAEFPPDTMASNQVDQAGMTQKIWTDYRVAETARWIPSMLPPVNSNAVVMVGMTTDGVVVVYNTASNGWDFCTNDARGNLLAGVAAGAWAEVSVCQDFAASHAAVFLNGRLLRQEVPFITNQTRYATLRFRSGVDSTGYVDNVFVSNAVPESLSGQPVSASSDLNGDGLVDAVEIMQYGALANTVPGDYASITSALAAASSGDRIVANGARAESVLVSNSVTLLGAELTGLTSLTVMSNKTLQLAGYTAFVVNNLIIQSGATVVMSNATLTANGATLTGSYTLNSGWGVTPTPSSLNFTNDFESYSVNMPLTLCGGDGWATSANGSIVQDSVVAQLLKAAKVEAESTLSNVVSAAGVPKVWTDVYLQERAARYSGLQYPPPSANRAVMLFVNTNNHVVIWNSNAWDECVLDVSGGSVPAISTGEWVRVSVFLDFTATNAAIFVNGRLIRQQVPFMSAVASFKGMSLSAGNGEAYVDDVKIWTSIPTGLTLGPQSDLDADGLPDAVEMTLCGNILALPRGCIFKIR